MAEVEERILRIKNHRGVIGLLIVDENGKVLRTTMQTQDKDQNPIQIARKVTELAKKARSVVRDIDPTNDLTFFRVRGKNGKEIMVAPDKNLFLIVLQRTDFEETHWWMFQLSRISKIIWIYLNKWAGFENKLKEDVCLNV